MKLKRKEDDTNTGRGAQSERCPEGPYCRRLHSSDVPIETRQELTELCLCLDPSRLTNQLDRALEQLWTMADKPLFRRLRQPHS